MNLLSSSPLIIETVQLDDPGVLMQVRATGFDMMKHGESIRAVIGL